MSNADDHKKKRTRSPAYPAIGLEDAIAKAQRLLDEEDRHLMPVEVATGHWDYKPASSAGMQAISALKQFGLLLEDLTAPQREVKLSPLALEILLQDEDAPERLEAIKLAALNPKIHRELWDKYEGRLGSDAAIRVYLTLQRKPVVFNKDVVDDFIAQFRATIAFSKLSSEDTIQKEDNDLPEKGEQLQNPKPPPKEHLGQSAVLPGGSTAVVREFPVPLMSGGIAVVKVPFPMSEEDYDQLTSTLEAWKRALVKPSAAPAPIAAPITE